MPKSTSLMCFIVSLALLSALGAVSAQAAEGGSPVPSLAEQEWVPRAEMDVQQLAQLPEYCSGQYNETPVKSVNSSTEPELPVHAQADSLIYWTTGKSELLGGVRIEQGATVLETEAAFYYEQEQRVELPGVVDIRESELVLRGKAGEVNLNSETARLDDAEFVLLDSKIRGSAKTLVKNQNGDLGLEQNVFTRCEPGNNNWSVKSKSLTIEEGAVYGTARGAVLRVKNVPVFYTPYIKFPVSDDRQSGLLFPDIGFSGEDGLDLTVPYYFNLAPNYDLVFAPRIVSKRGLGFETDFRHLSAWSESQIAGAYLFEDDLSNGELSRKDFFEQNPDGVFRKADRWLINVDHRARVGRVSTVLDYNRVSDDEYFRDLGSDLGVSSQVQLERRAELRYRRAGLSARFWAQGFQNLDPLRPNAYQRLPELELGLNRRVGPFRVRLSGEWASFDRENATFFGINKIVGDRLHIEPRLELPLNWTAGFLKLSAAYKHTEYKLQDEPLEFDSSPKRNIGLASADGGLFFDREVNLFGIDLLQTLEPRVFYLYQQFKNQDELPRFDSSELTFGYSQLFRDNRFTGLDRLGDANQLSLGVSTRFIGASNGREYFRASLGRISYFKDRRVTLNTAQSQTSDIENFRRSSALAGALSASLGKRWRIGASMVWDTHERQVDESNFFLQYKRDSRRLVNLGYRSRELNQDINQADISTYWALSRHWSVIGRFNYDLEFNRTIETFGGLEYNDCCWQIRLLARKYIDNPSNRSIEDLDTDRGIFFQIVFKGLAGFGGKIDNILENGIRGFQRRP